MTTYLAKARSAEDFYTAFTEAEKPTKIDGEPTYADVNTLRETLCVLASKFPTTLGGGAHGHLGLVLTEAAYTTIAGVAFVRPPNPVLPPFDGLTGPQIAEAQRRHAEALNTIAELRNLDEALVRVIVETIPKIYLDPLRRQRVGLLGRTCREIVTWLFTTYGIIDEEQIVRTKNLLQQPYNPVEEPFQVLVSRFQDVQQLADDAGQPLSQAELISYGIAALQKTGVLGIAIREWKRRPAAQRENFAQFTEFFSSEIRDFRINSGRGTGMANHMKTADSTDSSASGDDADILAKYQALLSQQQEDQQRSAQEAYDAYLAESQEESTF